MKEQFVVDREMFRTVESSKVLKRAVIGTVREEGFVYTREEIEAIPGFISWYVPGIVYAS